ncbi:MAG: trimethylamine methyltransferase family protein [Anaerolineae bacterium]
MAASSAIQGGRTMLTPLGTDGVERIHRATLEVLERTGAHFHGCPAAIKLFREHGCTVDGERVCFPPSLVAECLAQLPDRARLSICVLGLSHADDLSLAKGVSHVGLIGNAYYIYDYERGHRDCTEADVDDKALILDSLRNFEGDYCNLVLASERMGQATSAHYANSQAAMGYIRRRVNDRMRVRDARGSAGRLPVRLLQRSDDERKLEVLSHLALYGADATRDLMIKGDTAFVWVNPISPLQYHPGEADGIINVARAHTRSRVVMISPEVMLGATGPVTLAGALIQHNAEVLAGTILAQLAQRGTTVIYGCVSAVMDLHSVQISQGNFETFMLNTAAVQLADYYGMPSRVASGNTSARQPGVRAAVEAVLGLYAGLASGANLITTALLDSTLMVSYEHLVLVDQMVDHLRKVIGGIATDDLSAEIAEIATHGHPSPEFMSSDYTLERMTRDVLYSDYSGRVEKSYEDWYSIAHKRVEEVLSWRKEAPKIDATTLARLSALEASLASDDKTWRREHAGWWMKYAEACE